MKTEDNKYRFNIQFDADNDDNIRVGEFLNRLKNKKSLVIVAALTEYLNNHPETLNDLKLSISVKKTYNEKELKEIVENIIRETITAIPENKVTENTDKEKTEEQVNESVFSMLDSIDLF